ncbi:FecCD family ABC transporter permease [Pelosinus propionicus]|uniref:Iron complex transport system permease protein n=1 Tax=Pelosinus propionicus DSM 13327 TaxID=1123291 RepID=A0A1I4N4V4_9FIRM|nr:iron ABC transporter permease [Pelosinus propionicus]SFM10614.1 iron complex transport system permease protein [Pelosinus propionicus DSM 13327]
MRETMRKKTQGNRDKAWKIMMVLSILLLCIIVFSISWGTIRVPWEDTLAIIGQHVPMINGYFPSVNAEFQAVVWNIRMPRVLVGVLVGAALGVSGAVMQGVFGNPLADPGIIGVSSGASFGAVTAIALGLTSYSIFVMPMFALAGSLAAVSATVFLSMSRGKIPVMTLLLSGVAVSMLMGALTSGILTLMNEYRVREYLFWVVGGLDYRRWEHVYLAVVPILIGLIVLCLLARHLNVLVLGEQEARSVGVPVVALRLLLLFVAAATTAMAVCVSGTIGFVGLIVPHIMRIIVGPEHRWLLPSSALAGALFLVFCDTLGRMIFPPNEIRVGIMTALLGAPYFLYLLRKTQQSGGIS